MRDVSPYLIERTGPPVGDVYRRLPETDSNLRDYWRVIIKHVWLILFLFAATVGVTAFVVFSMAPEYTAETTLMIERSTPQVLDIRQIFADQMAAGYEDDDYYKSQYALLQNETLAARVIRKLHLTQSPYFKERPAKFQLFNASIRRQPGLMGVDLGVIDRYLKRLRIIPVRGTNLVKISFTTPDPDLSARIVNAHAQAYIQEGLDFRRAVNEEAQHFLEAKLGELKQRVEKSEAVLNAFGRTHAIISLNERDNIVIARLNELNNDLTAAEADRIALEAQHQLVKQRAYESLPAVIDNDMIQKIEEQLVILEGEYARLAGEYKPGFRKLDQVGDQVTEVRNQLKSEIKSVVAGIETRYMAALTKEQKLRGLMEEQKALAMRQKDASVTYNILAREANTNRELYESVLQRMKQTGVQAQIGTSNIFIVVKGAAPSRPSSPARVQDILISALLSLVAGIGLACLLESLDNTFQNPNDIERYIGVPALAAIPDFIVNGSERLAAPHLRLVNGLSRTAKRIGFTGKSVSKNHNERPLNACSGVHPEQRGHSDLIDSGDKFSSVTEAYRVLRAALMLSRAGEPPRTILFTSALPAEGKTTTAANTAVLLSHMGQRVLLVDTDLRRPRCHDLLNLPNTVGLTEVLTGQLTVEDAISPTSFSGLSLLSAGSLPPSPNELLGSQIMRDTLGHVRRSYDYVVLDATPLMILSDALPLSTIVDGCVVVVKPKTSRDVVLQTCNRLGRVGANILGVVLNGMSSHFPDINYNRHYYNDYQSGS